MNPEQRGRVLFVCDRPVTDPAVASVAAELGYEVLRVGSAADALAYAAPPGFALILAGFSGTIVSFAADLRRLREAFPPTPLVAIGLPPVRSFTVEPIYEAGAIAALDDPISPPVLRAKARFYLDAYATAAEVRRSEERYRSLFDSVSQGVAVLEIVDDAGGKPRDLRLLEVNQAFVRHLGWQDAAGRLLSAIVPGRETSWVEVCARVAANGEAERFVTEAPASGRWFDFHLARVGPAGSRKVVALFDDVTERRRNELELRRLADDLAEQDRRKTEFLATLAHELRNPMAPLRSGLQFMRRAKGDPAAVARVQDIMDRQLDHLVHLVDDLLDVARITRGQIELKPDWIDLAEVLRAAVDTSMPLIDAARHRLDLRLPQEPLTLYADPTRITQVVANLLNNAAKYTPRGGAIVLAAECDGPNVVIVVSDNGIGIPAESLEDVFQMFTQVSHTARPGEHPGAGGLGIGLSLVRSLVELHGGTITAASRGLDAGSVFTVRLPLAGSSAPEQPAPRLEPQAQARGEPLRVLVVDDNRDAGDTLAALLGMMGHTAPVAADGHQALRMIAGFHPQVVFLDLGMPGMSGYEVAQEVRKDPRFDGVRLVALTGWGGDADRARTRAAGFDAHLTKPATLAAIEAVLADLSPAVSPLSPA